MKPPRPARRSRRMRTCPARAERRVEGAARLTSREAARARRRRLRELLGLGCRASWRAKSLRRLAADRAARATRASRSSGAMGAHVLKVGCLADPDRPDGARLVTGLALERRGHRPRLRAGGGGPDVGGRRARAWARAPSAWRARRARRSTARSSRGDRGRPRDRRVARPLPDATQAAATSTSACWRPRWRLGLPATVHVAIGTDIVHMHPACDPAAVGRAHASGLPHSARRRWRGSAAAASTSNVGSAVLLPEVFLKAVTLARNLGHDDQATSPTANLDFIQSYRPAYERGGRPTQGVGRGYSLTGHHEILSAAGGGAGGGRRRPEASVRATRCAPAPVQERQADAPDAVDADVGVMRISALASNEPPRSRTCIDAAGAAAGWCRRRPR